MIYNTSREDLCPLPEHNPLLPGLDALTQKQRQVNADYQESLENPPQAVSAIINAGEIEEGRLFGGIVTKLHETTGRQPDVEKDQRYISSSLAFVNQISQYIIPLGRAREISVRLGRYLYHNGLSHNFALQRVHSPSLQWEEDEKWFLANRIVKITGWIQGVQVLSTINLGTPDNMTKSLRYGHYIKDMKVLTPDDYEEYMERKRTIVSGDSLRLFGRDNFVSVRTTGYYVGKMPIRVPLLSPISRAILKYRTDYKNMPVERPFTPEEFESIQGSLFDHNNRLTMHLGAAIEVTNNPPWGCGLASPPDDPLSADDIETITNAYTMQGNDVPSQLEWATTLHKTTQKRGN